MNAFERQLEAVETEANAKRTLVAFQAAMATEGYCEARKHLGALLLKSYKSGRISSATFILLAEVNMEGARRSFAEETRRANALAKAKSLHAQLREISIPHAPLRTRLSAALTMFSNYLNGTESMKAPATLEECVLGPEEFLDSVAGMWNTIRPFLSQPPSETHDAAA